MRRFPETRLGTIAVHAWALWTQPGGGIPGLAGSRAWLFRAWAGGALACLMLASPGKVFVADASGGTTQVKVRRVDFKDTLSSVGCRGEDAPAEAGEDYAPAGSTLTLGPNVTERTIRIPIFNDAYDDPNRSFRVQQLDPSVVPLSAGGLLTALADLLNLNEDGGPHRIFRRRWDGVRDPALSPQTVEIDLRGAWTALPWRVRGRACDWCWNNYFWDYSLPTLASDGRGRLYLGSIARANGQRRRGMARLDMGAPIDRLEIRPGDARLDENAGATTVTVLRGGDAIAAASYRWNTADGPARGGIDHQVGSGVVDFAAGNRVAILPLVLIDNPALDTDRTVRIEFTDAAGRRLPPAIVTVVNDDLGFLPGGLATSRSLPGFLRPTGHLVRRGHSGGAIVVSAPALSALRSGQWVGWANAFLPETLVPTVKDPVAFLSFEHRTEFEQR